MSTDFFLEAIPAGRWGRWIVVMKWKRGLGSLPRHPKVERPKATRTFCAPGKKQVTQGMARALNTCHLPHRWKVLFVIFLTRREKLVSLCLFGWPEELFFHPGCLARLSLLSRARLGCFSVRNLPHGAHLGAGGSGAELAAKEGHT